MPIKSDRILVIRTDRIGDVVLTTPVFKALRKANPAAHITVMVTPLTADLVSGNPYIDEIIVDDRDGVNKGALGFLRLSRTIRRGQFDLVFIFHTKRRYNLACFLAGVPVRAGFKNDKFGNLLTHPLKDTRCQGIKHESEYCLDVLKLFGIESAGIDIFVPTQKSTEQWAAEWFSQQGVNPGELIALHPGASDHTRLWPAANYARLIDHVVSRYALKIVLIGGKDTGTVSSTIMRLAKSPVLDLTGKTTIAQTASILRRCRLLVSSDSGPLHVAAGVGTYVICLFLRSQPGINPVRWGPLGPKAFMLTNKPGEEILLDAKGKVKSGKADSITVEEVVNVIEEIMTRNDQGVFYW